MYKKEYLSSGQPTNSNESVQDSQDFSRGKKILAGIAGIGLAAGLAACDSGESSPQGGSQAGISSEFQQSGNNSSEVLYGDDCFDVPGGISLGEIDLTNNNVWANFLPYELRKIPEGADLSEYVSHSDNIDLVTDDSRIILTEKTFRDYGNFTDKQLAQLRESFLKDEEIYSVDGLIGGPLVRGYNQDGSNTRGENAISKADDTPSEELNLCVH